MRIADKRKTEVIDFCDLDVGAVFSVPNEGWYGIKLADTTDRGENAVDLSTGHLVCMDDLDQIMELRALLEIVD